MSRPSRRCSTILLLLALVLMAPWPTVAEAAGGAEPDEGQSWDLAARFWQALVDLWSQSGPQAGPAAAPEIPDAIVSDEGCSADPNGLCRH